LQARPPVSATGTFRSRLEGLGALLAFLVISIGYFGAPVLAHPSKNLVGFGTDPGVFVWFFAWWPHALGHGLNPFITHAVWAPAGFNLAGTTAVPGPSLVALPLTEAFGPIVAFNVVTVLAPALSAWTAYLLCRHVTGTFWPSAIGGYVFGFSTYEAGQMLGHLNLTLVMLVPVAVLLVLRRLEDRDSPRRFVLLLVVVLVGQFLVSTEVSLTLALFGGFTLLLATALVGGEMRWRLVRTAGLVAAAYGIAAVALSPYLYYFFAHRSTDVPIYPFYPETFSIDAVNPIVPTFITRLGVHDFAAVSAKFTGNTSEQTGYLGLPLLGMMFFFAATAWRTAAARVLLAAFVVVLVCSFGPILHVAGTTTVTMPWHFAIKAPLVKYALPSRFTMYLFMLAGVMAALWLAGREEGRERIPWIRWAVAGAAVVALFPNVSSHIWRTPVSTPSFFAAGTFGQYLSPDENVLIIPFGANGDSMLWQAQAGLRFRMPEGYLTVTPPKAFAAWPILDTFYSGTLRTDSATELKRFLGANRVGEIVVDNRTPGPWQELFGSLGVQPQAVGGVMLYQVPASVLKGYANATPASPGLTGG
jgi:hypothetical protein